jgi:hypothetical protein
MCMFNILYEVDVQLDLYYIISYLIVGLSSILNKYYMGSIMGACACCILCDIHLNSYCLTDCIVTVLLSSISDDEFYIYVHRSLDDTLNMNMNVNRLVCV